MVGGGPVSSAPASPTGRADAKCPNDRHLSLGFREHLVGGGDRVLFVDDWIETGGHALGAYFLTDDAGATGVGAATMVDALRCNQVRRQLNVRSSLHLRDL